MMRRALPVLAVLLISCSSDDSGPLAPPGGGGTTFQYSFSDPVGDTLPPPTNVFQRALDVAAVRVGLTADSIFVKFEFTSDISRWSSGALNSIDGFLDFDFDNNSATGFPAATEEFADVNADMGVESYFSLRDDGLGHVGRRDGVALDWRMVPVSFQERSFTVRFARADVAETDGKFRISAMIGGTDRMITDLVPGTGHYRVGAP